MLGGHPRALSTLFFTEMWERFTFHGMRALLVLFLVERGSWATSAELLRRQPSFVLRLET